MAGVKLLLDTHAFLWRMTDWSQLGDAVNELIDDPANTVLVSAASAWEISTKTRLGKLPGGEVIMAGFATAVAGLGATELPITAAHAVTAGSFEMEHRDPFDRMLAAQAGAEGAVLITRDPAFDSFPVATRW